MMVSAPFGALIEKMSGQMSSERSSTGMDSL